MSASELMQQIDEMSDSDRIFAAAYLQHLANESDGQRKVMLNERMLRMDAGHKISLEQLQEMHHTMEAAGL